jgi:hypothetical protein
MSLLGSSNLSLFREYLRPASQTTACFPLVFTSNSFLSYNFLNDLRKLSFVTPRKTH